MSRFVSGGTNEEPTERDEEWKKAQQEIETRRREKAEAAKQDGGKSLFDTLQANKAAKQEQFEESIRLKNQFRSLDEDEVEFLDSVLETTRAKEAAVKRDTIEQLDAFRRQQEEAEKVAREADSGPPPDSAPSAWSAGTRKRKKARDEVFGGVKLRRTSSLGDNEASTDATPTPINLAESAAAATSSASPASTTVNQPRKSPVTPPVPVAMTTASGLGLGAYSSDDDE